MALTGFRFPRAMQVVWFFISKNPPDTALKSIYVGGRKAIGGRSSTMPHLP